MEQLISDAEKEYEENKSNLGDDHPDTLASLNNLAELYYSNGHYDHAFTLYEELLAMYKENYGDDHPDTLASLNNLAELFRSKGEYDRALPLYEECLAKKKRVLGDDNPSTLISLNNLAILLKDMGDYDRALPLFKECLAKRKRVLGDDNPDTLESLNNLAKLRKLMSLEILPAAAGGGRNKKRHFRKSKKSRRTKRSRSVRRSRNRKGGMSNKEIKNQIKKLALTEDKKNIDDVKYTANYNGIYSLWRNLGSEENKNKFEEYFVNAADTFFVDHRHRVPLYQRIITDLKKTDSHIKQHPEDLGIHKSPPPPTLAVNYKAGGKSRRRHRHRRSSKKYRKVRKSRRRVRS